jgi:hypothetical protein
VDVQRHCVTLAGYDYAVRHGMKVQLVTPYRVNHLQSYGVTIRGNVTSVYPNSGGENYDWYCTPTVLLHCEVFQLSFILTSDHVQ